MTFRIRLRVFRRTTIRKLTIWLLKSIGDEGIVTSPGIMWYEPAEQVTIRTHCEGRWDKLALEPGDTLRIKMTTGAEPINLYFISTEEAG